MQYEDIASGHCKQDLNELEVLKAAFVDKGEIMREKVAKEVSNYIEGLLRDDSLKEKIKKDTSLFVAGVMSYREWVVSIFCRLFEYGGYNAIPWDEYKTHVINIILKANDH